jgi:hypothetical protein
MRGLRGLSIRNKLVGIIAVATLIPLAAGFTVVIVNDARALRRELVDNTVLIARVTAENSVSDIAFNDHEASLHTLEKLASIPNLRWATVYDAHGHQFSRFAMRGAKADTTLPTAPIRIFSGDELRISEPIAYQGERYGTVYLADARRSADRRCRRGDLPRHAAGKDRLRSDPRACRAGAGSLRAARLLSAREAEER